MVVSVVPDSYPKRYESDCGRTELTLADLDGIPQTHTWWIYSVLWLKLEPNPVILDRFSTCFLWLEQRQENLKNTTA